MAQLNDLIVTGNSRFLNEINGKINWSNINSKPTIPTVDNVMQKGVDYVTAGQLAGSTLGIKATAEGKNTVASGNNSHAEGLNTSALGVASHTEGGSTYARGSDSHTEGYCTTAYNESSHAEGLYTSASGTASHAEGNSTVTSGQYSHAEGSHTTASGQSSHAEGDRTLVSGEASHAEGQETTASGESSHAEGNGTTASGKNSHAEGIYTSASGQSSHAEGFFTTASNYASHAGGHYNATMTTGGDPYNTTGTAFVIGNGVYTSALSNAFSVQYDGTVKAASTITASTTADYAEYFEWSDENPDKEDRVGHFVTFDESNKIRIANSEDDYILGIVSGEPFVLGNGDCDVWNGMVMRDDFRRVIYEPAPLMEINPETGEEEQVYDEEGNPVYQGTRPVYNPDYDPSIPYINRKDRPEWAPIGMLGVLAVIDDGTCEVNSYCTISDDGIATKSEDKSDEHRYRVIKRNSENVVEVVFK